jgi:hypothetical protein
MIKIVAQMIIEEVHQLSYAKSDRRVVLRNVTCEDIGESYRVVPGTTSMELIVDGERAIWFEQNCGEFVMLEIKKWPAIL